MVAATALVAATTLATPESALEAAMEAALEAAMEAAPVAAGTREQSLNANLCITPCEGPSSIWTLYCDVSTTLMRALCLSH